MSFEEFKAMLLSFPPSSLPIIGEFQRYVRSGCSESEAKRWLALHLWEFPTEMQDDIIMAFAADRIHRKAERAEEALQREFLRRWQNDGYAAAHAWYEGRRREDPC